MELLYEKLVEDAKPPHKTFKLDAGFDIFAAHSYILYPNQMTLIDTGLVVGVSSDKPIVGIVKDRSSWAMKQIVTFAGVIDLTTYRGPLKILMVNLGDHPFQIIKGDKISQILVLETLSLELREGFLDKTNRGSGGFGSTGNE